jgi:CBS domain-containing protein
MHRGTVVAAWGGRVTACAVLLWPVAQRSLFGVQPDVFDFLLAVVIAFFLWNGATASLQAARVRRRIPHLVARNLARRTLAVPEDLPLSEAVRRAHEAHAGAIVTVTGSGRPVGVVNEAALMATPEERRPWLAVSTVTRGVDDGLSLPVSIAGEDLVRAITRAPASEYLLVEDDGSVYGVLTTADVDRAFRSVPD